MRVSPVLVSSLCAAGIVVAAACSDVEGNYFHQLEQGQGGAYTGATVGTAGSATQLYLDSGANRPPTPDASGLCGNQVHAITSKPPTIYFVFDISGSMVTAVPGGTRYSMLQAAAYTIVKDLRYVIKFGAAAFPLQGSSDACHAGAQIYAPQFDDPVGFDQATSGIEPSGGTPTAATITALTPMLSKLPGKTIVILTTDGGANCDAQANCTTADCTENIEGCPPEDACCQLNENCCSPTGPAGPVNCLDRTATVNAVTALAATGVKAYIIGIPGSKPYATLLTQMAFAGGAPQASTPYYYDVEDLTTLTTVLEDIAGAEVSCEITIDDPPETIGYTNVYLGQQLLANDPANGWSWVGTSTIELNGKACNELRSGEVSQVQVVTGCPTETQ